VGFLERDHVVAFGALDFEFGCYRNFILYTIIILHLLFEYIIITV